MTCKHCCFACTAKGTDMSRDTFHKAIALARDHESNITIGGGEPTLHPLFKEFLWHAIWELASVSNYQGNPAVFMVTNGSNTDTAITLARLAQRGVIGCRVSKDQYHDPIDPKVFAAFKKPDRDYYAPTSHRDEYDCRDIGNDPTYIQAMGRAKNWGNRSQTEGCCGGLFVTPRGNLYACECKKVKLGTISEPLGVVYEHFYGGHCSQSEGYKTEVLQVPTVATVAIGGEVIKI